MSDRAWLDLVPAYVLDALDEDERAAFDAQLERDAHLRSAVDEYRQLMVGIAESLPTLEPPPSLRDRVIAEAKTVTPIAQARPPTRGGADRGRAGILPWLLVAAGLAASVGFGVAYRASTTRELDMRAALAAARSEVAQRDSLLATFLGPRVRTASLASTGQPPAAHLFWNQDSRQLVLAAFDLPPARDGRTYQLWGIASGQDPVSLGLFQTAANGTAVVVQTVPAGLDLELSAVTDEPAGGSAQPTTTPFLAGAWSAAP